MQVFSPVMLKLKTAEPADAGAIASLAERIWRVHYPPIIGAEQVEYMLTTMHTAAQVGEQMQKGTTFAFVMYGADVAGYIATSAPAQDELFIHKFYIDPAMQGKGIGKLVFDEILELNPRVKAVRLTVNRMNYKSINFYYKVGFVIEEVKDFDIGGGYFMNDYVMKYVRK
jgi:ribosomal protein S18 acetylase RimI-like enzyme